LIARIIRMLHQGYQRARKDPDERWWKLGHFLEMLDPDSTAILSLNWDTVAETRMLELHRGITLDYGEGFTPAKFPASGSDVAPYRPGKNKSKLRITKLHGSVNWLYCDNCRRVFWFPPDQTIKIADQLLSRDEWREIAPRAMANAKQQWTCAFCSHVTLSTRIATFSYRKALDFPMFQYAWSRAERLLRAARRWIFVGYSLPAADFEFKYLLKRVELSHPKPLEIVLITGGDGAKLTRNAYEGFFGERLSRRTFPRGISKAAVDYITRR
jgi:hypothetical protein